MMSHFAFSENGPPFGGKNQALTPLEKIQRFSAKFNRTSTHFAGEENILQK